MVYAVAICCSVLLAMVVIDNSLIPRFSLVNESMRQRFATWDCAIEYIREHPLLGQGMLSFRHRLWTASPARSHAHNLLLSVWSEYGLFGLLAGGIAYSVGAIFYGVGHKKKYMHSVFHIFVVLGSALQLVCILYSVL